MFRLERHLAGFHASFGSHHCILCGNRFKYDYNLLYHYRRSCPYTRAFIDHDVREQVCTVRQVLPVRVLLHLFTEEFWSAYTFSKLEFEQLKCCISDRCYEFAKAC